MQTSIPDKWNDNESEHNAEHNTRPNPDTHTGRSIPDPEEFEGSEDKQGSSVASHGQNESKENRLMNEGMGNAYGSDPDADDLIHDLEDEERNPNIPGSYDGRDSDPDADEMTDSPENELI